MLWEPSRSPKFREMYPENFGIPWIYPTGCNPRHQDDITFLVGNPKLNLYFVTGILGRVEEILHQLRCEKPCK